MDESKIDPSAPPEGPRMGSTLSARIVSALPFAAVAAVLCAAAVFFNAEHRRADEDYARRIAEVSASLPERVSNVRHTQHGIADFEPDVHWTGEGATILKTVRRQGVKRWSGEPYTAWHVLARTPSGRFFEAQFEVVRDTGCERTAQCLSEKLLPRTDRQVKAWLHHQNDPKLFQDLFKEAMPPREIKA